ncbi:purine nucleoside permease [Acetobacter sp. AN02]|uniref:purine nucleoside permease n=1 Tax=Acetobacter sp. AN02 TaxID=2894186 RepID=UPI0024341694|nr:purine nucleoside permease [Acetobacter sp. AN02]MDG6094924.1 purine nucleoside permease [Acetobacter sp. AN02]
MPLKSRFLTAAALGLVASSAVARAAPASGQIPVRVVVVTTFEIGKDTGDTPGEFQTWVEKLPLSQELPAPGTDHGVMRYNPQMQVLGIVSGEGPEHMASAITGLVLDPRFDLRKSYFVLAGIAGIDPRAASIGSAVWTPRVVNGGLSHLIDPREIPKDWSDGYTPVQGSRPDEKPVPPLHSMSGDMGYTLNPGLTGWAFALTKNIPLPDTAEMKTSRARYTGFPEAMKPPSVLTGDTISSETFWVGPKLNDWAERWVKYWTGGQGHLVTTAEEDIGFMQALSAQAKAGRVDMNRVLLLRTGSNYDMPPPGQSPAGFLNDEEHGKGYAGFLPSVDSVWRVGSVVVKELALHWDKYENNVPSAPLP